MNDGYSKSLGPALAAYAALRELNQLCLGLSPGVTRPYALAIDTFTVETVVFFEEDQAALARAFGATPCTAPFIDGQRLVALDYVPLPFVAPVDAHADVLSVAIDGQIEPAATPVDLRAS